MTGPVSVGVIGAGSVSEPYLRNLTASPHVAVVGCADEDAVKAEGRSAQFGLSRAYTNGELLADPAVELVVNLTVPSAHAEVTLAALAAGKHVYSEKPLATTMPEAARILEAAAQRGLTVGCAPHTFLGAGIQTCLRLLERGDLGAPLAGDAFFFGPGPEAWHPNPGFFYKPGGGPLLDMGPYYITTLVCVFGPIRRVTGMARILYSERVPDRGPHRGENFKVTTPTFVAAALEFESGAQASLVTTFGIPRTDQAYVHVYCADATLSMPDPNTYAGPIVLQSHDADAAPIDVPMLYSHTRAPHGYSGLGAIETALAIRSGRGPRPSGELAYHVLDVMLAILESAESGRHVEVASRCGRPAPLPLDTELAAGL